MAQSYVRPDAAIPVSHPAGAKYRIRPTGSKEIMAWRSSMRQKMRDEGVDVPDDDAVNDDASKALDQQTADALQLKRLDELIEYAAGKVVSVSDIVDEETGEPIPSSQELILALLEQTYEDDGPDDDANRAAREDGARKGVLVAVSQVRAEYDVLLAGHPEIKDELAVIGDRLDAKSFRDGLAVTAGIKPHSFEMVATWVINESARLGMARAKNS
jgi:hypothetical protein